MAAVASERVRAPEGPRRLLGGLRPDGGALGHDAHVRRYGPLPPVQSRHAFVELVAASGLRGRGGGGFPVADKLTAVLGGRGRPVVVANGTEGEPPSAKDKVLLAYAPQLVLDGAVLAARAVGAKTAIVAVGETLRATVERAISDRSGRDRGVGLQAIAVPDRFVAGEETALVQFINGGPALPTFTPPRPFERGVGGEPTLVQNAETLAHLALIARFGPEWFRSIGTAEEPGSALLTLSGAFRRPGVYEVPFGLPLTEILEGAGGAASELQAWLVGGLFGTWITAAEVTQATLSGAGLAPFGAAPGARAIIALPVAACGVAETARVARYLAEESAGQCGPCVHGLDALAGELEQVAYRGRRLDREVTKRRLASVKGRGACRHPDGAVRLIASAMRVFAGEYDNHERLNRCSGDGRAIVPVPARRMQAVS